MRLNVTIGSTSYNLGVLRDSYSFTKRCGDAGRHSISSVKCSVRPIDAGGNNFGAAIFQADGLVPATLSNGGTTVFTGYIRPYTSTSARNAHADDIELEIMDPTESMHEYVWPVDEEGGTIKETVYQGKTLKENITTLFGLVGKTCDTSGLGDYTMPWFRLSEGEYIDEVIAQVLFEFGYDYMWTADGTATFFSTFKPSSVTRQISDIRNTLTTSRSDDTSDGLKITYSIYRESPNVRIYNHSHHYSFHWWNPFTDGTLIEHLTGKYWKGFMHDSHFKEAGNASEPIPAEKFTPWKFDETGLKNAEGKDISASDVYYVSIDPSSQVKVWLEDEDGISLTPHLDEYDATGARFWVDYSGNFNVQWTWRIEIYGKLGYRVDSEVSFNKVGPNPETMNLRYRLMLDGTVDQDVQAFASKYATRKKAAAITYGFDSLTEYDVGGFYLLENTVGGSSQVVRIISRTLEADGIYSYKAEGASTVEEIAITTSYSANAVPLKITAYEQAASNGFTGTEEDFIKGISGQKTFTVDASSLTYTINKRLSARSVITINWTVVGYSGTPSLSLPDGITGVQWTPRPDNSGGNLYVRANTAPNGFTVTIVVDGELPKTISFTGIDNTEYDKYFGASETAPSNPIIGDAYFNSNETGDDALLIKTWNGTEWVNLNTSTDKAYISEMSAKAMKDALSIIKPGTLTASDYAYFNSVVAGVITADYIGARNIRLNEGGYIESYGYENSTENTGFRIDSEGNAVFYGAKIIGGSTFKGSFDCGVIKTKTLESSPVQIQFDNSTQQALTAYERLSAEVGINETISCYIPDVPVIKYIRFGTYEANGKTYRGIDFYDENYLPVNLNNIGTVSHNKGWIQDVISPDKYRIDCSTDGVSYLYVQRAFTVTVYRGGNKLWVSIPNGSGGLTSGMLYVDNGFVKIVP